MQKKVISILAIVLFCVVFAKAGIIADGTVLPESTINGDYSDVVISDTVGTPPEQVTATVTGGNIVNITINDTSILNLDSGVLGTLYTNNNSAFNVYGGTFDHIYANDSSVLKFYGGNLQKNDCWIAATSNSELHFYGYDFNFVESGSSGWLTGKWEDGTEFGVYLRNMPEAFPQNPYEEGAFIQLHIVPETATLTLFSLGLIGFISRKHS